MFVLELLLWQGSCCDLYLGKTVTVFVEMHDITVLNLLFKWRAMMS